MSTLAVLAVCLDPSLMESVGKLAGYIVVEAGSIRAAIEQVNGGDFDLVLLGHAIPAESRERLTFLLRATGSQAPVVSIAGSAGLNDSFADATFEQDSSELMTDLGALLKSRARTRTPPTFHCGI